MVAGRFSLSSKIIGVLVVFFLVALMAIGMTLFISWQLEGAAAAINDMGSQRMRSYRIGYLLARSAHENGDLGALDQQIRFEVSHFESVQDELQKGNPHRPLFLPREPRIREEAQQLQTLWQGRMRPLIERIVTTRTPAEREMLMPDYDRAVTDFVTSINQLVLRMEQSYAHSTTLLRTFQLILVGLAIIGTILLIGYFFLLVIQPILRMQEGIRRMAAEDFSVRLPVVARDEFGELAEGFNHMADHLADLYTTLEERVETKTQSLAEKNRELGTLYEIAAFLNEPQSIEDLCRGFLRRVSEALGADASSVRLYVTQTKDLYLLIQNGLSEEFARGEAVLRCGECLCGEAVSKGTSFVQPIAELSRDLPLAACRREGIATATAFTIGYNKEIIGLYNLFFRSPRVLTDPERRLLETLGQHLGVAVENQRLKSRDKELAVAEERNMLAQELHDSIAQSLAFLNLQVQVLEQSLRNGAADDALDTLSMIREGVQESYDDVRELLVHFRTRLNNSDLEGAISSSLQKFEGQTGIATTFNAIGSGAPIPPESDLQVLHIVQESLSNVRKHAKARQVDVTLERDVDGLTVRIRDNGIGFDPERDANAQAETHVGLKIMRERAHRIGGRCEIRSVPGQGTEVLFTLPRLQKEAA